MLTKRLILLVALSLFCLEFLQAQNTFIKVTTVNGKPIHLAKVEDYAKDISDRTNSRGLLNWQIVSDSVVISAWNFKKEVVFINRNRDTLFVKLIEQPELLQEAQVKSENSWLRLRIYAFERWENGWIFLMRNKLRVTDEKLDLIYMVDQVRIGNDAPTDLYVDALDNLFLVSKDSVQQLYVTDTMLYRYEALDRTTYEQVIKPMKLVTDKGIVFRESKSRNINLDPFFANILGNIYVGLAVEHPPLHNCGALFSLKASEQKKFIYSAIDTPKYRSASAAWGNYMGAYIRFWQMHDATGIFDVGLQRQYGKNLHTYNTLHAHFKETFWIQVNNNYIVLDPYSDQMVLFNQDMQLTSTKDMDFNDCPKEEYFTIDEKTKEWWLIKTDRKLQTIHPIRPNTKKSAVALDAFISNVRTHDDRVFYIDQYGSFRMKQIP